MVHCHLLANIQTTLTYPPNTDFRLVRTRINHLDMTTAISVLLQTGKEL